tara:strand:- start:1717 stop:1935 length:219 start_codon:yes stop_codon:yes gene_type:complete
VAYNKKKGLQTEPGTYSMNMDSFFSIVDGKFRIFGILDGHGEHGHIVSSAAMSILLDYIRNRNDVFKTKTID